MDADLQDPPDVDSQNYSRPISRDMMSCMPPGKPRGANFGPSGSSGAFLLRHGKDQRVCSIPCYPAISGS